MNKYNSILRISNYTDEGKEWVNISFVTSDHQEHELTVEKHLITTARDLQAIPVEYRTHPACCEHPTGCPEETNTERLLKNFNKSIDNL